jgi:hypothetical protein
VHQWKINPSLTATIVAACYGENGCGSNETGVHQGYYGCNIHRQDYHDGLTITEVDDVVFTLATCQPPVQSTGPCTRPSARRARLTLQATATMPSDDSEVSPSRIGSGRIESGGES